MEKTEKTLEKLGKTGNPSGICFQILWQQTLKRDLNVIDATEGEIKLWLKNELIWGENIDDIERGNGGDWIELLEFLCLNWHYICHEENHILFYQATKSKFLKAIDPH